MIQISSLAVFVIMIQISSLAVFVMMIQISSLAVFVMMIQISYLAVFVMMIQISSLAVFVSVIPAFSTMSAMSIVHRLHTSIVFVAAAAFHSATFPFGGRGLGPGLGRRLRLLGHLGFVCHVLRQVVGAFDVGAFGAHPMDSIPLV